MKLTENMLKDTSLLPVSYVEDIKISVVGIEGFVIEKNDQKREQTIPLESAYLLAKGVKRILARTNRYEKDKHCYDTSDDFNEYYNRAIVEGNKLTITYWEKYRNPEWDNYIVIEGLDVAERVCDTIIQLYDELDENFL